MRSQVNVCLRATLFLVLMALFMACGHRMKMSGAEVQNLESDEGLVLGSILIQGGKDILGRTAWHLVVEKEREALIMTSRHYYIEAHRGQDEEVFLTKMVAGRYHFTQLVQPGFSTAEESILVPFEVLAGKTVYLGRLVIEFPEGTITQRTRLQVKVEDDEHACVKRAEKEFGVSLPDVVTHLMNRQ